MQRKVSASWKWLSVAVVMMQAIVWAECGPGGCPRAVPRFGFSRPTFFSPMGFSGGFTSFPQNRFFFNRMPTSRVFISNGFSGGFSAPGFSSFSGFSSVNPGFSCGSGGCGRVNFAPSFGSFNGFNQVGSSGCFGGSCGRMISPGTGGCLNGSCGPVAPGFQPSFQGNFNGGGFVHGGNPSGFGAVDPSAQRPSAPGLRRVDAGGGRMAFVMDGNTPVAVPDSAMFFGKDANGKPVFFDQNQRPLGDVARNSSPSDEPRREPSASGTGETAPANTDHQKWISMKGKTTAQEVIDEIEKMKRQGLIPVLQFSAEDCVWCKKPMPVEQNRDARYRFIKIVHVNGGGADPESQTYGVPFAQELEDRFRISSYPKALVMAPAGNQMKGGYFEIRDFLYGLAGLPIPPR